MNVALVYDSSPFYTKVGLYIYTTEYRQQFAKVSYNLCYMVKECIESLNLVYIKHTRYIYVVVFYVEAVEANIHWFDSQQERPIIVVPQLTECIP